MRGSYSAYKKTKVRQREEVKLCYNQGVFFTLFPKITQVCVKVNCYTILCKIDEVFTQSNVGVLTFYTMLCKNVNLYTGMCNDSLSKLCKFTQSCVILHLFV